MANPTNRSPAFLSVSEPDQQGLREDQEPSGSTNADRDSLPEVKAPVSSPRPTAVSLADLWM